MSRADIEGEQRTPFYLYVDEFQNFATDSFATILSEARKYGLNLTVANQYTAQMMQEVKDAVFGNVGSIISFRTSADDARGMLKYFEPKFEEHDMVHMHNRHFALSMTIGGEKVPAFSAISLNLPPFGEDYSPHIIAHSRSQYTQSRETIERYVKERYMGGEIEVKQEKPPRPRPAAPARVQAAPTPKPAEPEHKPDAPAAAISQAVPGEAPAQTTTQEPAQAPAQATAPAPPSGDEPPKPKRKRVRRRKKKAGGPAQTGPSTAQVARAIEDGVIHLR
jgi:hypothetical protein